MTAWYNEIDPFAAEWLRRLIKAGHIAPGVVDTRDIRDISPHDLHGFTQLHLHVEFAALSTDYVVPGCGGHHIPAGGLGRPFFRR